ncbi:MAG: hypothetical protein AAB535_00630 [Patescibacteria group bacterium]
MKALEKKIWWSYLEEDLQGLISESLFLLEKTQNWKEEFHDYSFVVFPAAKAYEGFLKKMFLDLKFITETEYYGKHFRIGRALNPSLSKELMKEGIYNKIVKFCGGVDLADKLWETWKLSRNLIFHWFPNETNAITLKQAEERIGLVIDAIDQSFKECNIS